jgi:molybdate transport system substrate-binding protein
MTAQIRSLKLTAILALVIGAACGGRESLSVFENPGTETLTIYAAASLAEVLSEIGEEFEDTHPGSVVAINFAGSQQLAQQLSQGAPADIYASADKQQMENVIQAGRVTPDSDQAFIHNHLVVVLPGDNPGNIRDIKDLARPGLQLLLADEAVPVGRYSQEMLDRASEQAGYGMEFKERVLENVVSYEENVRAVLTKIILGEADAGIVYVSDVIGVSGGDINLIQIPEQLNITASYYIAPLSDSSNLNRGRDFIRYLLSPRGQEIFERYGFSRVGQHE